VAMTMIGEVQLPASRGAVWAMLNEPAMLKSCMPGCESLDKDSDSEFRAVATRATYIPLALTLVLRVPHGAYLHCHYQGVSHAEWPTSYAPT
jgi:hypothetical protein